MHRACEVILTKIKTGIFNGDRRNLASEPPAIRQQFVRKAVEATDEFLSNSISPSTFVCFDPAVSREGHTNARAAVLAVRVDLEDASVPVDDFLHDGETQA